MLNLKIDLINKTNKKLKSLFFQKTFIKTLEDNNYVSDCSVNIHFVRENEIKKLNNKYRNLDKVTDVLSFGQFRIKNQNPIELGDIFICTKRAKEQSKNFSRSVNEEILFLANHGLKHLIGIHHK